MAKNKLLVPEARKALDKFKIELANEFDVDDPNHLASMHTGVIVRDLIEMGKQNIIDEKLQYDEKIK
ncbi:alpha/beta-type small acid-soluble spore protein [Irregularibacter muris]|uniref:Alpha/beta-type small acid-soluble spore protein n=1 Tax=Irregularibacter muris TaxID=1796619 RepID=A0AAE3L0B6_9FIRM|nr:alpha/beta-type small acid-soluble spore protein [Irregularibacter muris]MCR1899642.1 alpha/beta-type small acid-soluble spore protein [Irregularibacter muris]